MELVHINIPPVHSSSKQAVIDTEFTEASGDNPSCDEDSNDSRSPLCLGPVPRPPEKPAGSTIPSLIKIPPPPCRLQPLSGSCLSLKLTNGAKEPHQRMGARSQVKPKSNLSCSAQRHKKPVDNGPKMKKLKYHQYIPPEQKGNKEPPPDLDSSYTKILKQQQLFLQLQILSEQQQHNNYHPVVPAPSKATKDQLGEMKVAELKSQLKLRSLPVYGTKNELIERLWAYKELNGGCDITSSPTVGGTTGPGAAGAGNSADTTSQQLFQTSSFTHQSADASSSATPHRTTQQLMTGSGTVSLIPFDQKPAAKSPEDGSFNSDPSGERISSPLTQLSLQVCSVSRLPTDIEEEPSCSHPTPCQCSLKPPSLQKHCPVSSTGHTARTRAAVLTVDKDKMLQEKDKQIEKLTRMLRQKQKLVEVLKMQLENGKRGGQVPNPVVLVRVKQEPPDVPLSHGHSQLPSPPSSISCELDATKLTVKQKAVEAEEVVAETTLRSPDTRGFPLTEEAQKQILLQMQIKPEPTSPRTKKEQHICLLLQQEHDIQNYNGVLENQQHLRKLSPQRKKKSHKQQQKQQRTSQQQQEQPKQHGRQMQPKQQTSSLKQQIKPQQLTNQPQQIQIQINLKQQQVLIQQNLQLQQQQQSPQVSQASLNKQPGGTDVTERQRTKSLKATNHVTLQQTQNGVQVSGGRQQGAAQCLSAPPGPKPFFKAPSGKNTISPSCQTEDCSSLDVLVSPLSPGPSKVAASSPGHKDTEPEDDLIGMILQTGDMPTVFKPEPDLSPDCLYPNSSASSPCTSPLQLLQSPSISASCESTQPALVVQSELESLVDPTEEKQHLSNAGSGRLEDFLESTTEKSLLGEEPGGLLVLIDDLHSRMLFTPSILDHPPSPMDTFHMASEAEQRLNFNDWLDFTMGGDTHEETPTLAPLGPQTPCGVFSADFLDNYMME